MTGARRWQWAVLVSLLCVVSLSILDATSAPTWARVAFALEVFLLGPGLALVGPPWMVSPVVHSSLVIATSIAVTLLLAAVLLATRSFEGQVFLLAVGVLHLVGLGWHGMRRGHGRHGRTDGE
jgi:hypothetical protein